MVPSSIHQLSKEPRFWDDYFFGDWYCDKSEDWSSLSDSQEDPLNFNDLNLVRFPLGPDYFLTLNLSGGYVGLSFAGQTADPVQIAWDDTAHWHPHVLRWDELELACRLLALADPTLPHPGIPLLLLARFAPIVEDSADSAFPMTQSAWQTVGYRAERLAMRTKQFDRRGCGYEWKSEPPLGWTISQSDEYDRYPLYTLRSQENAEFPFKQWNDALADALKTYRDTVDQSWLSRSGATAKSLIREMLEQNSISKANLLADSLEAAGCRQQTILEGLRSGIAARICWIVELLADVPIGSFIVRHIGPTKFVFRPETKLTLNIPEPLDRYRAQLPSLADEITPSIDEALKSADIGWAKRAGFGCSTSYQNEVLVAATAEIKIILLGDFKQALPALQTELSRCPVPIGSWLLFKQAKQYRILELGPDRAWHEQPWPKIR